MENKEKVRIYELALYGPRMGEEFKLSFPVSRRQMLLLCLMVENGINPEKGKAEELAGLLSAEMRQELAAMIPEILKKGGDYMPEYYARLKTF